MKSKTYHHGDLKNALIQAGVEILAREGITGLSLRKVALKAGVSHSAPYAHFPDKQSLIAAISTEGFNQLYAALGTAVEAQPDDPMKQLTGGAMAYIQFALDHRDIFKIMFSSVLEKEKEYPAFVEISQKTFQRVVDVVAACQGRGILGDQEAPELIAVAVWGQVHGITSLVLEGQISHTVLDRLKPLEIVSLALEQMIQRTR